MDKAELLQTLRREAESLNIGDEGGTDRWRRRAEMIISKLFGADSRYARDLSAINFYPMVYPTTADSERSSFASGRTESLNLVDTMIEDLQLLDSVESPSRRRSATRPSASGEIFVVHGRDEAMKESVARVLEQLGLRAIVLHEQANQGRTVIEKFTDHANVAFAIVLLSPDDVARPKDDAPERMKTRARQNVIFELGFFIGRLGRERVVALYRQDPDFEMPSDYAGVVYVPFEPNGAWKFALVKELSTAGFSVDANKIL